MHFFELLEFQHQGSHSQDCRIKNYVEVKGEGEMDLLFTLMYTKYSDMISSTVTVRFSTFRALNNFYNPTTQTEGPLRPYKSSRFFPLWLLQGHPTSQMCYLCLLDGKYQLELL